MQASSICSNVRKRQRNSQAGSSVVTLLVTKYYRPDYVTSAKKKLQQSKGLHCYRKDFADQKMGLLNYIKEYLLGAARSIGSDVIKRRRHIQTGYLTAGKTVDFKHTAGPLTLIGGTV